MIVMAFALASCKTNQMALKPVSAEPATSIPANNIAQNAVKKDSAFAVISIDKIRKTVYRGLKNPLTIIVPNAITTKVEGNGLMKIDNQGHYDLRPGPGTKAEIKITATMPDGSVYTDVKSFNVKNVPNPQSHFANVTSGSNTTLLTEEQIKQGEISLMIGDFDYELELIVTGFEIIFPNGKKVKVEGNRFNSNALEMLKKVRNNGLIKIQNIVAFASEKNAAALFRPDPITFKLNKKAHPKR